MTPRILTARYDDPGRLVWMLVPPDSLAVDGRSDDGADERARETADGAPDTDLALDIVLDLAAIHADHPRPAALIQKARNGELGAHRALATDLGRVRGQDRTDKGVTEKSGQAAVRMPGRAGRVQRATERVLGCAAMVEQDLFISILATFGLAILLAQLMNQAFGADVRTADAGFGNWFLFDNLVSIAAIKLARNRNPRK